jgi:release factor glutamine methyltransferase
LQLRVGSGVFVPRPETEVVAQAAIDALAALPVERRRCVDLCAGSGAIALAVATEVLGAVVDAVEIDGVAAEWARRNVADHAPQIVAAGSSVTVHQADAITCAGTGGLLSDASGRVEVVIANPPYIPDAAVPRDPEVRDYDPALALYGGVDGLDVIRGVIATAGRLLRPGGLLVVEHADVQGDAVAGLLEHAAAMRPTSTAVGDPAVRWVQVRSHLDLTRRPRFVTARKV